MEIRAKKSLGQNFLKDQSVLQKIADSIETEADDLIIEIGPGTGALTEYLSRKKGQLLAYEIDKRMESILKKYSMSIIFDDFLRRNLSEDLKDFSYKHLYILANIPYYITTPIIEHVIRSNQMVEKMTLLVQEEVANRFVAKPGMKEYGYFTVYLNYYYDAKKILKVPNTAFSPVPKVNSAVVLFLRKEPVLDNPKFYFQFIKKTFAQKRKTLKNNLKGYDWSVVQSILTTHGYPDSVRSEQLPPEILMEIAEKLN